MISVCEEEASAAAACRRIGLGSGTAHYWATILIFIFLGVPHNRMELVSVTAASEKQMSYS